MSKLLDCHIHTRFSPDGVDDPEKFILKAIDMGMEHICITDHMDLMYFKEEGVGLSDLSQYYTEISALKEKYRKQIYVGVGIECGFTTENKFENAKLLKSADIEYVINSVHSVKGSDCYYQEHFYGKTKEETYNDYFDAVFESLDAPYHFCAVGHLSYISRTAPYVNKIMRYADFKDKVDLVLKKIISKNAIIELNTNVYGCGTDSLPDIDIIKRYSELGGKLITFSSDAHRLSRLGDNYEPIAQKAKAAGFSEWAVIQNKAITFLKI